MNPEIEASLDAIAEVCRVAIAGNSIAELERFDGLLKSLLMSGYDRAENRSLEVNPQKREKDKFGETASRGGGELSSLNAKLASKFADHARQQSRAPADASPPKATNISNPKLDSPEFLMSWSTDFSRPR